MCNARARARQLSVTRPWRERKPIGPVGAALTVEQKAKHTEGYVRATSEPVLDAVCDGCGYHVHKPDCPQAPKSPVTLFDLAPGRLTAELAR